MKLKLHHEFCFAGLATLQAEKGYHDLIQNRMRPPYCVRC